MCVLLNCALFPTDKLLRFMLFVDASEHRHEREPLLFAVLHQRRCKEPISLALAELTASLAPEGDTHFFCKALVMDILTTCGRHGVQSRISEVLSLGRQLVLHQLANVWYRLRVPLSDMPFQVYGPLGADYYAMPDVGASRAEAVMALPPCCRTPHFDQKVINLAGKASGLRQGLLHKCLMQAADSINLLTGDIERDHKTDRVISGGGFHSSLPVQLDTLAVTAGLRRLLQEHRRRGGRVPKGVNSKILVSEGCDNRRHRAVAEKPQNRTMND